MTPRQRERLEVHQKLSKWENSLPDSHAFDEDRKKIAKLRRLLNEEAESEAWAEESKQLQSEFINAKAGQPESFSERVTRIKLEKGLSPTDEELAEWERSKPSTQKQQRELRRKEHQAELERVKLTQDDILAKCNSDGGCKITINDLKNAFPKMISQVGDNAYMTQINNKQFHEFLLSNGLTFSLPDFVFKKQA